MSSEELMFSKELRYDKTSEVKPSYRWDQIIQIGTNGTTMPSPFAGQPSIFELPSLVYNLSKSYLTYTFSIPAVGANRASLAYNGFLPLINQIQFYDKRKVLMLDLPNVPQYTKIIFPSNTKYKDFLSNSTGNNTFQATTPSTTIPSVLNPICINNALANSTTTVYTSDRPNTFPQFTVGADDSLIAAQLFDPSNINYVEMSYGSISTTNTINTVTIQFNFNLLKNTILALDKDICFGDFAYLNIIWNGFTSAGYSFRTDTNAISTAAALPTAFPLSNLYLYLAVETNENIVNYVQSKLNSDKGIDLLVDFPYAQNFPLNAAFPALGAGIAPTVFTTQQAFYVKYGPGIGLRLKKVYWTAFNAVTQPLANQFDNNNVNSSALFTSNTGGGQPGIPPTSKIAQFQTKLNNKVINQYPIDCTQLQDYLLIKDYIKDSVLQNSNIYQYNWFWVDVFDSNKTTEHNDDEIAGLPLNYDLRYDVNTNAVVVYTNNNAGRTVYNNANYIYYTFGIVQRQLIIKNLGVVII